MVFDFLFDVDVFLINFVVLSDQNYYSLFIVWYLCVLAFVQFYLY